MMGKGRSESDIVKSNKKIRVIHFTIGNIGGGITKFVLRLWKYIDRDKFQFDFVTMSPSLDFADELLAEGCKIYYLSTYAEDDREKFIAEVEHILDNGYDVMYLHTQRWRGFVLEEIGKRMGVPRIIVHSHNSDVNVTGGQSVEEARRLHFEQRALLSEDMATDFLACSRDAATWLYGDRIPAERIQIIPCAIETDLYRYNVETREKYRRDLQVQNKYVVGHVGRFAYQKNHEFLIDAFYELSKECSDAVLLLVGTGELEDAIKEKAARLGIADKIIFTGKRNDVAALMQAMDVFAFPSRFEGFGIVLIEAQAAGLKCLVSKEIPEEARITDNIEYLPLDIELWKSRLLEYSYGYERTDMSEIVERKGFGIYGLVDKIEAVMEPVGGGRAKR